MISISAPIKDSNRTQYYLEMARTDYYANRYEKPGYWAGKGAELLGLSGPVYPEVLQNLFDGFSPDGKTKLVQNAGSPDRQKAIDLTPAPPKPFSVYWAMASPEERIILERIHDEAVQAAREFLEEKAGFTRRGHGGKEIEPSGRSQAKTSKKVSKNCYQLKHRRWGNILWRVNLGIVEIRIQMRNVLPKAPSLNPASKVEVPAVRIVPWKIPCLITFRPTNDRSQKCFGRRASSLRSFDCNNSRYFLKPPPRSFALMGH